MSDNLPTMGVITAPVIKYAVSIHEDVLYGISKSFTRLGIAGMSIVSPYIVMSAIELSITKETQASLLILSSNYLN